MANEEFLRARLDERHANGMLRTLSWMPDLVDFTSNDYLGIRRRNLLHAHFTGHEQHGAGGSRLLSGNYPLIGQAEEKIARFHAAPAARIFNSGYAANLGVMGAIPQRGDTIFYDQLCHASIRDGIRLSLARHISFNHNDANDLEKKLKQRRGNCFVVTESVFSMDGDVCPLNDLVRLCERYDLHLILDEAHAIGAIGNEGEGLAQHLSLHQKVFARIYTFGKALGCHGAAVVGSDLLSACLVNFARPFIYSTAPPEASARAIMAAYECFPGMNAEREALRTRIAQFGESTAHLETLPSVTPIQGIIVKGNAAVGAAALTLQRAGLDVRPIRYPTVPAGSERLRINLHAFNTPAEIERLVAQLRGMVAPISKK